MEPYPKLSPTVSKGRASGSRKRKQTFNIPKDSHGTFLTSKEKAYENDGAYSDIYSDEAPPELEEIFGRKKKSKNSSAVVDEMEEEIVTLQLNEEVKHPETIFKHKDQVQMPVQSIPTPSVSFEEKVYISQQREKIRPRFECVKCQNYYETLRFLKIHNKWCQYQEQSD